jgi:hypothetical protein
MQESTMRYVLLGAAASLSAAAHAGIDDSVRGAASEANHYVETPAGWQHPMTPWGEPDIRALLDMMQASRVPLERCAESYRPPFPACDMNKKWLTDEEYAKAMEDFGARVDPMKAAQERGDLAGEFRSGRDLNRPQRQTNLIVDPPDGLLPALTPEAKRLTYEIGSDWALPGENINFQSKEDFDSWDRCITRGMPSMMMPYRYNGGFRIHQAPGYVVLETEMIHEARIIPTNGAAPLDPAIKQYLGESRGRWEGTTLVIETTNYRDGMEINNPLINLAVQGSPPGNRFPQSDQLKTTERIVRLNDDWWLYEITAEDPAVLTGPFTVRYPMHHDADYIWPEYACHEDNTIVPNFVVTNRVERANPTPEPPQPPVQVSADVADALAGRWVGRPRIVTIDVDIEIEFMKNADGTVNGKLIGTTLGEIDQPFRDFAVVECAEARASATPSPGQQLCRARPEAEQVVTFTLPNVDPWNIAGELTADGTIAGNVYSIQGGMPVTFRRASGSN